MAITLHFDNPNPPGVKLDIYRDTKPIDRDNLPAPIASFDTHVTEFTDNDVIKNFKYFYVFRTTGPVDSKVTRNIEVLALDDKGAGPDRLITGNLDYGYYGVVPNTDFFTYSQLLTALKMPGGSVTFKTSLHKYSWRGKTVIVGPVFYGLTPEVMKAQGMVEGKIVQWGQFKYRARMMKGWDPRLKFTDYISKLATNFDTATIPDFDCEFDRLMFPICLYVPRSQKMHNVDGREFKEFGIADATARYVLSEDDEETGMVLCRGWSTTSSQSVTSAKASKTGEAGVTSWWYPLVLELITEFDESVITL